MENKVTKRESLKIESLNQYSEHSISFFEEMIVRFKNIGATHIEVSAETDYEGRVESIDFDAIKNYYETDEEMEIRRQKELKEQQEKELAVEKRREDFERNLLRQLKEKYETTD